VKKSLSVVIHVLVFEARKSVFLALILNVLQKDPKMARLVMLLNKIRMNIVLFVTLLA
jgi:hypothetical protein